VLPDERLDVICGIDYERAVVVLCGTQLLERLHHVPEALRLREMWHLQNSESIFRWEKDRKWHACAERCFACAAASVNNDAWRKKWWFSLYLIQEAHLLAPSLRRAAA
jgi:hypothetical protein